MWAAVAIDTKNALSAVSGSRLALAAPPRPESGVEGAESVGAPVYGRVRLGLNYSKIFRVDKSRTETPACRGVSADESLTPVETC